MPRPRHNADGVRVHRVQSGTRDFAKGPYSLYVPNAIARLIGPDAEFRLELTDEGLLYRKVSGEVRSRELPEWLR
jgi:hypothetical protein